MEANQIATNGSIAEAKEDIINALKELLAPDLAKLNDKYMTVEEIAAFTQHDKRTVRSWITEGKKDQFGEQVKLKADEFCPGKYRALKSEVIAFGQVKWHYDSSRRQKTA